MRFKFWEFGIRGLRRKSSSVGREVIAVAEELGLREREPVASCYNLTTPTILKVVASVGKSIGLIQRRLFFCVANGLASFLIYDPATI
jgi:hypothetical protein